MNIMGGTVIETESEKLIKKGMQQGMQQGIQQGIYQGKAQIIIEIGQEEGMDDATVLKRLQDKVGLSVEQATAYLEKYGKHLV